MQQMTARSRGHVTSPELRGRTQRRPLDLTFARRLRVYETELAERESRVVAEQQDLAFLRARLARVETALHNDRLVPVFQPIIDLRTGQTCGSEALSRFTLEPLRPPDQWFAEAAAAGLGLELEMHAIRSAVDRSTPGPFSSWHNNSPSEPGLSTLGADEPANTPTSACSTTRC